MLGANIDHTHSGPNLGHQGGRQKALTSDSCVWAGTWCPRQMKEMALLLIITDMSEQCILFLYTALCIFMLRIINIYHLFFYFHI